MFFAKMKVADCEENVNLLEIPKAANGLPIMKGEENLSTDKGESLSETVQGFIPELHGMRGLSALSIAFGHAYRGNIYIAQASTLGFITFLMLSGHLITGILLRPTPVKVTKIQATLFFALSRIVRIYPALLIASLYASYTRLSAGHEAQKVGAQAVTALLQVENFYVHKHADGYLGHTWYLGMEQQFYAFWPIFVYLIKARSTALRLCVLLALLLTLHYTNHRTKNVVEQGWWNGMLPWHFLILGGAMQLIPFPQRIDRWRWLAWTGLIIGVAFISCASLVHGHELQITSAYFAPVPVYMMIKGSIANQHIILRHSALVFLGRISYAYFLFHVPLLMAYRAFQHNNSLSFWIVIGAIVPASVSTLYIEEPLRDYVKAKMASRFGEK